jgi:hypothetical protein
MPEFVLSDSFYDFASRFLAIWKGPGTYRIEKIEDTQTEGDTAPPESGIPPRHRMYREPILVALHAHGGQAHVSDLKPLILSAVLGQLTDRELNSTKSNRPFWWYDCQVQRYDMLKEGLIREVANVGYWELTEKGTAAAKASSDRHPDWPAKKTA